MKKANIGYAVLKAYFALWDYVIIFLFGTGVAFIPEVYIRTFGKKLELQGVIFLVISSFVILTARAVYLHYMPSQYFKTSLEKWKKDKEEQKNRGGERG